MLEVKDLVITGQKDVELLHGVSLGVKKGERIAITGSSGSGKTTLMKAIMGIDDDSTKIKSGKIMLDGEDLTKLSNKQRRRLCGRTFGFIPQSPMTAFFPNTKIGIQMAETFRLKLNCDKKYARSLSESVLRQVNLSEYKRILHSYPSELSGGMLQRITTAIIIGTQPTYIFADEPTSALDAENRLMLVNLIKGYSRAGMIFASHDYEAIQSLCKTVYVLSEGYVLEQQETSELFNNPKKEWTKIFMQAVKNQKGDLSQWIELK